MTSFFLVPIDCKAKNNADVPLLQVNENLHLKNFYSSPNSVTLSSGYKLIFKSF